MTVHPPRSERPRWDSPVVHDDHREYGGEVFCYACSACSSRANVYADIIRAIWPDVDERWSCNGTSDTIARMVQNRVLTGDQAALLRRVIGEP